LAKWVDFPISDFIQLKGWAMFRSLIDG